MAEIAIDARPLNEAYSHGITVYLRNLVREMTRLDTTDHFALLLDSTPRDGIPQFGPHVRSVRSEAHRARVQRNAAPALQRADLILAISEATRTAVIARYGIPPDRINFVPLACDRDRFNPDREEAATTLVMKRYGVTTPVIIADGRLGPRKNLSNLIRACSRLKQDHPIPHRLVPVGQHINGYGETAQVARELGVQDDVLLPGYVRDDDLPHLLRGADLFVFPTLHEGFGIPILEAMACGVLVVASEAASVPEVLGVAALLVDPLDVAALADGMARVIHHPDLRSELVRKGLLRAQEYSWRRTAQQTLDLVNGLLR